MAEARPKTAEDALKQLQDIGSFWDPIDLGMRQTTQTESPEQSLRYLQGRYGMTKPTAPPPGPAAPPPPDLPPAAPPPPPPAAPAAASPAAGGGSAATPTKAPTPPASMASLMGTEAQPGSSGMDVVASGPLGLRQGLGTRNPPQYNYALASLQRAVY